MTVSERFQALLANLTLTDEQKSDGTTKHKGVRKCLNSYYHGVSSETANSMLIGSWGKATRIRPPRDIDVLFEMPWSVFERFQRRPGNKQSQLLQEVKGVLQATYPRTAMRGDGQVVMVPFVTYAVEVAPAFRLASGRYWICDTNDGGSYKEVDPNAEREAISASNEASNNNTRDLIRMMKCWQGYCNVPLKSFWLELLAMEFLRTWEHRGKSAWYYDWMSREFLRFLLTKVNSCVCVPGTYEIVWLGSEWKSRAETALGRAEKACSYEAQKLPCLASDEWQRIFGGDIPRC